ncbi:unnamed protein product, partial [Ectocarpus fasciculatus]
MSVKKRSMGTAPRVSRVVDVAHSLSRSSERLHFFVSSVRRWSNPDICPMLWSRQTKPGACYGGGTRLLCSSRVGPSALEETDEPGVPTLIFSRRRDQEDTILIMCA